jgi:hypothetical protein
MSQGEEEIINLNEPLTNGTKMGCYLVKLPPKEVMRFMRAEYDGSRDWPKRWWMANKPSF